jgi:quercetin dioxygenase-like cupin family protein
MNVATARTGRRKPLDALRHKVNFRKAEFKPYHLQGEVQKDLSWYNLSYDEKTGMGFFLVKFEPGATSIPHEHLDFEEFVILEGEITDSDGTVYRAGDCVSLQPGSRHVSTSGKGAISAVFVRGGFRTLSAREKVSP